MHELGIMYHVIRQVTGAARENELTEVEAIVLQVGEYASVIPRYLHACFPAAVDGTFLKNTKLEIEILPANGLCRDCRKVFHLPEFDNVCPVCGGQEYELLSGSEFFLKEIRAC